MPETEEYIQHLTRTSHITEVRLRRGRPRKPYTALTTEQLAGHGVEHPRAARMTRRLQDIGCQPRQVDCYLLHAIAMVPMARIGDLLGISVGLVFSELSFVHEALWRVCEDLPGECAEGYRRLLDHMLQQDVEQWHRAHDRPEWRKPALMK